MEANWRVTYFKPDRQGEFFGGTSVRFAANMLTEEECGVILYDQNGRELRFPFSPEGKRGTLYGLEIKGGGLENYTYNFYMGKQVMTSPYAREICGLEKWGECQGVKRRTKGRLACHDFDWQGDEPLMIPLKDSILYGLNVRAFTMHKSSGVRRRGTFEGIVEKIPYLKKLGITAVVLMPCYEYDECMLPEKSRIPALLPKTPSVEKGVVPEPENSQLRLNCWGFQKGFYFAPKASYSAQKSPVKSFKNLVRELHKNGIEIMMQFYFPSETGQLYMIEVLKYWVEEYHIDGARVSGFSIPCRLFAEEPVLKNTKIWCDYLPVDDMHIIENPVFKNFLSNNGGYRNDIRRFLKGDEGQINQMLFYQRHNPKEYGVVNYLADYDGFSLYDSVSYEKKHNEANGEENRDGTDLNYTWNCGVEGESRRKNVRELRRKQIKNALAVLLLSQGVPFLFSGDEFADSRLGNNNCYCQDNEAGWINWKSNSFTNEVLASAQFFISLRKSHPILHMKDELLVMDSMGCGYPDISYHGIEAWKPDFSYISRIVGILLCGKYAPKPGDDSFYIAYNMHWENHKLALPKPDKNKRWIKIADTSFPAESFSEEAPDEKIFAEDIPAEKCVFERGRKKGAVTEKKNLTVELGSRCIAVFKTAPNMADVRMARAGRKKTVQKA